MRKSVLVLLIGIITIMLCACGNTETQKGISKEAFLSYVVVEEVTTENWEEYFVCTECDYIEKDAFGEETGNSYTNLQFGTKENCFAVEQVVIELSYKEVSRIVSTNVQTGEKQEGVSGERECRYAHAIKTRDYGLSAPICTIYLKNVLPDSIDETYKEVKDITCTRVTGKMAMVSIPEDAWCVDEDGDKYLVIDKRVFYSMDVSEEKLAGKMSITEAIMQFVE